MDPVTISQVGLALSAVGAVTQYTAAQSQKEAMNRSAAEQRKQFAAQQRIADIKNARERANMARQARIARGALAQQGANRGVSTSTGVMGGMESVSTQAATNLGVFGAIEANQQDIISSQIGQAGATADAGRAQADSIMGGTIFTIGGALFKEGGGFKTIFDTTPSTGSVTNVGGVSIDWNKQ